MASELMSLPYMWQMHKEFWAPGFGLVEFAVSVIIW